MIRILALWPGLCIVIYYCRDAFCLGVFVAVSIVAVCCRVLVGAYLLCVLCRSVFFVLFACVQLRFVRVTVVDH